MSVHETLNKLKGVKQAGAGWSARCPAHEDAHNSLSVSDGSNGRVLLFCHAGCSHDQISAALGLNGQASKIIAVYDYRDERGVLLYQAVRFSPKGFSQRRPNGDGYEWKLNGVRRVPYHLTELLASQEGATVFIVEGEKDCDHLASYNLLATTNVGGAGKWRDEYSQFLRGRYAVILSDNDEPGRAHALQIAQSLSGIAASIKIVDLPDLPPKGDVSDWLGVGRTVEELEALIKTTPEWKPTSSQTENRLKRVTCFTFTTLDDLLAEPEEETAYIWDRTLPCGGFSICAAKPKVGKSTLARNLAVAISQGVEFFGRATSKGKVIYLCLEEKRAEVARHFRRMGAGGADIIIHTGSSPSESLQALATAIEDHSPALVVIDPLSRFVRVADFNSYGEVTRGLEPLIDLARTSSCQSHILAVHHNGKGEREGGDALLGSTGFFGAVDTLLIMKRRERARTLETVQRYGEDLPETVVHLDSESGLITPGGDMQTLLFAERKALVLESIGDEPLTEADIKERISGNQGLTSKAVRALHEEGLLVRAGAGKKGNPYSYYKAQHAPIEQSTDSRFPDEREPKEVAVDNAEIPNKNSRFLGFPISTDLENLESHQPGFKFPSDNLSAKQQSPPDIVPEEFDMECVRVAESHHITLREAAHMVLREHYAVRSM